MRTNWFAAQHPPATRRQPSKPTDLPSVRRGPGPALVFCVAMIGLASCGRSAPVDALSDVGSDPDIAGVSITSPDAVVTTIPSAEGETTTSSTLIVPQQILYTVQPGDTLSVIASSYGVTIQDLAAYNGITDVNAISPGLELAIPPTPIEVDSSDSVDEESSDDS